MPSLATILGRNNGRMAARIRRGKPIKRSGASKVRDIFPEDSDSISARLGTLVRFDKTPSSTSGPTENPLSAALKRIEAALVRNGSTAAQASIDAQRIQEAMRRQLALSDAREVTDRALTDALNAAVAVSERTQSAAAPFTVGPTPGFDPESAFGPIMPPYGADDTPPPTAPYDTATFEPGRRYRFGPGGEELSAAQVDIMRGLLAERKVTLNEKTGVVGINARTKDARSEIGAYIQKFDPSLVYRRKEDAGN